jgi:hypothetical protein
VGKFLDMPASATGAVAGGGNAAGAAGGGFLQGGGANAGAAAAGAAAGAAIAGRPGAGDAGRPGAGDAGRAGVGDTGRANVGDAGRAAAGAGLQARGNAANSRPDRIANSQERQGNRQQRRDDVRNQVRENNPRLDFWSNYPNWAAWRINRPYRWATWGAVTGWFNYGWSEPAYYNYGENIYYADDQIYYGEQPTATADAYANQAGAIAASGQTGNPQDSEWMTLGVFAVTQDGPASGSDPTIYVQLAVSKTAVINGLVTNTANNETLPLQGAVDKSNQRAAWQMSGKQFPVMETGIYNLTQDTTPVLVHFADGQTQQWLLVRLEEPKEN